MSDQYNIDSHKMMFHPIMVSKWYEAKDDWEKLKKIYQL